MINLILSAVTLIIFTVVTLSGLRLLRHVQTRRGPIWFFTAVAAANAAFRTVTVYHRWNSYDMPEWVIPVALGLQIVIAGSILLYIALARLDHKIAEEIAENVRE